MMAVNDKRENANRKKINVDTSKAISEKYEQMIREQEEFLKNLEREFPNLGVSSDFDLESTMRIMAMAEKESQTGTDELSEKLRSKIKEAAELTEKLNLAGLREQTDNPHEDQASDGEFDLKNQDPDPVKYIKNDDTRRNPRIISCKY